MREFPCKLTERTGELQISLILCVLQNPEVMLVPTCHHSNILTGSEPLAADGILFIPIGIFSVTSPVIELQVFDTDWSKYINMLDSLRYFHIPVAIENGHRKFVSFPIQHPVIFHSYVAVCQRVQFTIGRPQFSRD